MSLIGVRSGMLYGRDHRKRVLVAAVEGLILRLRDGCGVTTEDVLRLANLMGTAALICPGFGRACLTIRGMPHFIHAIRTPAR